MPRERRGPRRVRKPDQHAAPRRATPRASSRAEKQGYEETYAAAYEKAYRNAFDEAGVAAPKKVSVPNNTGP